MQPINIRSDRVSYVIAPHTIAPGVGAVCLCKTKTGLRHIPRGLQSRTQLSSLSKLNLTSSLKDNMVPFGCGPIQSSMIPLQKEATVGG